MGVSICARCKQFAVATTEKEASKNIDHGASSKVKCSANPDYVTFHQNATVENGKVIIANISVRTEPKTEAVKANKK